MIIPNIWEHKKWQPAQLCIGFQAPLDPNWLNAIPKRPLNDPNGDGLLVPGSQGRTRHTQQVIAEGQKSHGTKHLSLDLWTFGSSVSPRLSGDWKSWVQYGPMSDLGSNIQWPFQKSMTRFRLLGDWTIFQWADDALDLSNRACFDEVVLGPHRYPVPCPQHSKLPETSQWTDHLSPQMEMGNSVADQIRHAGYFGCVWFHFTCGIYKSYKTTTRQPGAKSCTHKLDG